MLGEIITVYFWPNPPTTIHFINETTILGVILVKIKFLQHNIYLHGIYMSLIIFNLIINSILVIRKCKRVHGIICFSFENETSQGIIMYLYYSWMVWCHVLKSNLKSITLFHGLLHISWFIQKHNILKI